METMPRGCTPVLRFTFSTVAVNSIAQAFLTIRQGQVVIEKTLADCTKEDNALEWKLTQQDTLALSNVVPVKVQTRYKLSDGTAGKSRVYILEADELLKDGVI